MARVQSLDAFEFKGSAKTTWLFLRVTSTSGVAGYGEITHFGVEAGARQKLDALAAAAVGLDTADRERFVRDRLARERDLAGQIILSGFEQALIDIRARELGVSACELLGGQRAPDVTCYANINRGTLDHSPEGFASRAAAAVAAGYPAVKLAPFDGVVAADVGTREAADLVRTGIDRVAAVRNAVGPAIRVAVDCHGRFNEVMAKHMIRELAPHDPFWVEEPVREEPGNYPLLRRIRSFANDRGIRVAGGEDQFMINTFRAIVDSECMDVVLPDVRFCGGPLEALRIGHLAVGAGMEFSLHNPVGPVLDAVSLRVAAAAPSLIMLERTFEEFEGHLGLTKPAMSHPPGQADFTAPGWGVDIDEANLTPLTWPAEAASADLHAVAGAGPYA